MKRLLIIYICICGYLTAFGQIGKLSPFVRQALISKKSNIHKAKAINGFKSPCIMAFVRTTDASILRQEGCNIYAQWDDIYIASIPLNKLNTLANNPQIKRIEAGESCSVTNDTTAEITRAKDVWNLTTNTPTPNTPITGKGVVVGVTDIGFDLTHPTFYSADGQTYRIKRLWDQLDLSANGDAVTGKTDNGNDTIYLGRQYIDTDSLLKKQHTVDGLTQTHGTHTAGTAAGSGYDGVSNIYSGMAPDADICLVSNAAGDNSNLIPDSLRYLYTTATDMLAFKYIFDYAESVGKPCVINFSEGAHDDLYQSGIYQEVISKMVGSGRILCSSAGNEGYKNGTYIHKELGKTSAGAFLKASSSTAIYVLRSSKPVKMEVTFYKNGEQKKWEYDATELSNYPDSMMTDSLKIGDRKFYVALNTYPSCFDENLLATDLFVYDLHNEVIGDTTYVSLKLLDENNDIEAFCGGAYFTDNSLDETLQDFDHTHNVLFPGSSKDAISVGQAAYRDTFKNISDEWVTHYWSEGKNGIITKYSSKGPALNNTTKPDVAAPGTNIVSSYNSFFRENKPQSSIIDDISNFTYNNRIYQWHAMCGTSMSSPVVTGIIALWLQVCPTLTPDQIKDVFAHSCTHYDESLTYPNNEYGYGNIDALAGLEYVEKTYTGIEQLSNVKCQMSNVIYDISGRRVKEMGHGIYVVCKDGKFKKMVNQ